MANLNPIIVSIFTDTLSDGSEAFDIVVGQGDGRDRVILTLPCVTLRDACELQEKLIDAIRAHTNEEVR